jgi:hypothetical protein
VEVLERRQPVALPAVEWTRLADEHAGRVDRLTEGHRRRSRTSEPHPVEDFLFTYYSLRPARLRRWHPGADRALVGAPARARLQWRWYAEVAALDVLGRPVAAVGLDRTAYLADRGDLVRFVADLLVATQGRPAQLGCFGLHEWAMVYREGADEHRHPLPLRLGSTGTDEVVESHRIRCTHIDAYRFFTPDAVALNTVRPTRASQVAMEQPGCLHAGMDVYKWATKLGPIVPGELLLDCFELARDIRTLDMRASPYDVTSYDLDPVAIETPEGKSAYAAAQRGFAERGNALRARLLGACAAVDPSGAAPRPVPDAAPRRS